MTDAKHSKNNQELQTKNGVGWVFLFEIGGGVLSFSKSRPTNPNFNVTMTSH